MRFKKILFARNEKLAAKTKKTVILLPMWKIVFDKNKEYFS